jgi:predicted Zn finger-like uncharacterized protein
MKITCPQCRTAYEVTLAALGSEGRQVRCGRCKEVWLAEPPRFAANVMPIAALEELGVRATPSWEVDAAVTVTELAAAEPALDDATAAPQTPSAQHHEVDFPVPAVAVDDISQNQEIQPTATLPSVPVTIATAPHAPAIGSTPPVHIESVPVRPVGVRKPPARPQRWQWRVRKAVAAAVVLAVVNAGLIVGRTDVVRALPQTASLYAAIGLPVNLRELAFKDVRTARESHEGVPILVVEGTIIATGKESTDVPRLRFAIAAANGHEIYAWTALPTRTRLSPGETLSFRTRLASPPEQGRSVNVRFFTRLDLAATLH